MDLMFEDGISGMRKRVSDTAEYGDVTRGPRIVNARTRAEMQKILKEIQSGKFAKAFRSECAAGKPMMNKLRKSEANHPVEKVGRDLRKMMKWINSKETRK